MKRLVVRVTLPSKEVVKYKTTTMELVEEYGPYLTNRMMRGEIYNILSSDAQWPIGSKVSVEEQPTLMMKLKKVLRRITRR